MVLLYQNIYQGHVYVWKRPAGKNYLMVMGIRNRIDTIWNRDDSSLRNVAMYIFEGVRLFANYLGLSKIAIVRPFGVIIRIITKMGFSIRSVPEKIVGNSIAGYTILGSFLCYVSANIKQPYIEGDFDLTII